MARYLQPDNSTMKIVIIVPTYNEAGNILPLIEALRVQARSIPHEMRVLVVDDKSPDGTGKLVREAMQQDARLHLLSGEKAGLGAAYVRGMQFAMNELGADVVFEMDADFSHKPSDVPRLLAEIEAGADFVIGSRYVPGGTIPQNWGWHRRLNSRFGNIVTRYLVGLRSIHDCTAGFRAIRTSLLKKTGFAELGVQGYAFQVALLYEVLLNDAVVKEIPVDFVDRTSGESKLGLGDISEFILNAWWIRFQRSITFVRFSVVGLSGVVVNLGIFSLLLMGGMSKFLASPVAIEASIVWNFLLNNFWTFQERDTVHGLRMKGLKFNVVSLLSLSVSYSTFLLMSYLLPQAAPQIPQLLGIIPATLVNYFLNSYWTFKENPAD
jgi:dolichol-phosphate mannosyltransferase